MCCLRMIYESKHVAAIKRVSVKILDYYNITVHWLVCNKLFSEYFVHQNSVRISYLP